MEAPGGLDEQDEAISNMSGIQNVYLASSGSRLPDEPHAAAETDQLRHLGRSGNKLLIGAVPFADTCRCISYRLPRSAAAGRRSLLHRDARRL